MQQTQSNNPEQTEPQSQVVVLANTNGNSEQAHTNIKNAVVEQTHQHGQAERQQTGNAQPNINSKANLVQANQANEQVHIKSMDEQQEGQAKHVDVNENEQIDNASIKQNAHKSRQAHKREQLAGNKEEEHEQGLIPISEDMRQGTHSHNALQQQQTMRAHVQVDRADGRPQEQTGQQQERGEQNNQQIMQKQEQLRVSAGGDTDKVAVAEYEQYLADNKTRAQQAHEEKPDQALKTSMRVDGKDGDGDIIKVHIEYVDDKKQNNEDEKQQQYKDKHGLEGEIVGSANTPLNVEQQEEMHQVQLQQDETHEHEQAQDQKQDQQREQYQQQVKETQQQQKLKTQQQQQQQQQQLQQQQKKQIKQSQKQQQQEAQQQAEQSQQQPQNNQEDMPDIVGTHEQPIQAGDKAMAANQQQPQRVGVSNANSLPIRFTQENEQCSTLEQNSFIIKDDKENHKIVQFVQYEPNLSSNSKQPPSQEHLHQEIQLEQIPSSLVSPTKHEKQVPPEYQGIQNQTLLKRIQELEQTVHELKVQKKSKIQQSNQQPQNDSATKTAEQTIENQALGHSHRKKKQQIIHDQSVHGLVTQLAKTEAEGINTIKKPVLQQKRYKRRKLDLTSLMDKNMSHASNIFNVTIGEILNPSKKQEQEKQILRKQIKQLREKVLRLEQDKRALSTQKQAFDTRRDTASTGKKQVCGKLIKVSELRASRISNFDDNDSVFKTNQDAIVETKSQRESIIDGLALNHKRSSATQRQQKQNPNNISFRVRRPSNKANPPQEVKQETIQKDKGKKKFVEQNVLPDKTKISLEQLRKQKNEKLQKNQSKKIWWQEPFIEQLIVPDLPSPPTPYDSQEDLYTLGKLTFIAFGINPDNEKQMSVKKYKNCVYYNIGEKNNILWYFDGRFYIGEWQVHLTGEGEKSGEGFQHVPGKFIYQGQFKQGKRNGFGKMKILNKEKDVMYQGNWVDGNKFGEGKQVDQYGIKYWGDWKQNKRQGFGRLKLEDGDLYEGNFQRGIKTGFGTQYFKNGDKYEGNYLANKFHGKGKYYWKNGSVYQGDFNHGIRSGSGIWKSSQINPQYDEYEGQYQNDKKNGFGKYKWADGSEYQGFFKDDLKEGEGTIRYKNGKVAKLLWRNGQPMKKLFSEEEKKYREQKSVQKLNEKQKISEINRNQTLSSRNFSIYKE